MIPEGFLEVSVEHSSRASPDSCSSTPRQALGHSWLLGRGDRALAKVTCSPALTPL